MVFAIPAGLCAQAHEQTGTDDEYDRLVGEALVEFDSGRWDEARILFERAHAIRPSARTLRGIGMAFYEAREYVNAILAFEASIRDERRPLPEQQRSQIEAWLRNAYRFVARYPLSLDPEDTALTVDGNRAEIRDGRLLLDDGEHEILASREGFRTERRRVVASPGTEETLHISLIRSSAGPASPGAEPPSDEDASGVAADVTDADRFDIDPVSRGPGRLWTWIAAGGAVVFGGAATLFWLDADARYREAERDCSPECGDDVVDGIETSQTLGNIFIGLSAASAVGAAVLFFTEGQPSSGGSQTEISAEIAPGRLSIQGRF